MSFAFLYPLAWLGALAVAAPIWLHLRRSDDARLIRFSAMRFLDDQPAARRRPLWPQHWPLLLLRLLGLLLLIAAFAWPYLPTHEDVLIRESRVYILDNTLSHQANGGFERARDRLLDELAQFGLATQVAVIELAGEPRVLAGFGDAVQDTVAKLLELKPSHQRGSYLAAFRMANRLLDQSLGRNRRIILLADSQKNQWSEELHTPPFLKDVQITLPDVASTEAANLALSEPIVRRTFTGDGAVVECAVQLYRQGDIETATVIFQANGKDVAQREVPLKGQPESLTLIARWPTDPAEWIRGQIRIQGSSDVLPADDRVVFALPPIREGHVSLLTRSLFLQTALSPDIMHGRWKARTLLPSQPHQAGSDDGPDDVLCVESQYLESRRVRERVLDALNGGKGVVLMIDRVTVVVTGFLRELGVACDSRPAARSSRGASAGPHFRYVFLEHPIFQPFRSADFGNLTEITVQRYSRLKMPGALPLVFSDSGDPLMFESDRMKGRLLVLAFSLDRADTNWPLHPTFIPFLDRCLQRARADSTMTTDYQPGEICLWTVPADRNVTEVVVSSESEPNTGAIARVSVHKGQAQFPIPDLPGLYALSYDGSRRTESVLAVNPSPKESHLTYAADPEVVASWQGETTERRTAHAADDATIELSKPEILRQRLWWWLVLAGLAILISETVWLSRQRALT